MKKITLLIGCGVSLIACTKTSTQYEYKGDLINVKIKGVNATLYINQTQIRSNIACIDTNIFLYRNDNIRIVNNSYSDTQNIVAVVNFNKYYSATYMNNKISDSIKACPSRATIEYGNRRLIFNIAYIF